MLHPMAIIGAGIVSNFGINSVEAFSRFFSEQGIILTETHYKSIDETISGIKINNYLSPFQKDVPSIRYMDIVSKKAIIAVKGAMEDACVSEKDIHDAPYRYGVLLTTSCGPGQTRKGLYDSYISRNGQSISATLFSNCGYNIAGSLVAAFYGMKGVNVTFSGNRESAFSLLERTGTFLSTSRIDIGFIGYTDYGAFEQRESILDSLINTSCILCMKNIDKVTRRDKWLKLECADMAALDSGFSMEQPLEPGSIYAAGEMSASDSRDKPRLVKLDIAFNEEIGLYKDYLLLIQLGFIWSYASIPGIYGSWILPVKVNNTLMYLRISKGNIP